MANKQIKEYSQQTTIDDADKVLMQDGSTDEYKYFLISVLRAKILGPSGNGAWTTWTPSYVDVSATVGNGALSARYRQVGKTVEWEYILKFGSTTTCSGGTGVFPNFSAPVAPATRYGTNNVSALGAAMYYGAAGVFKSGVSMMYSIGINYVIYMVQGTSGAAGQAFATNDVISMGGRYEAA